MKNNQHKWGLFEWGIALAAFGAIMFFTGISKGDIWEAFLVLLFISGIGTLMIFLGKKKSTNVATGARQLKVETYTPAGAHYYKSNIKRLAVSNPQWKNNANTLITNGNANKRIYRYYFTNKPVSLIMENNNPEDCNAVMIQIAGQKVGYIPAVSALHIRDILLNHEVKYISSFIGGGEYKMVSPDEEMVHREDPIHITIKIGYV